MIVKKIGLTEFVDVVTTITVIRIFSVILGSTLTYFLTYLIFQKFLGTFFSITI